MATVSIHYTSASEGLTLGVHGKDWMECLLRMEEEFGDGALPLYEKTRDEMRQLFDAVSETFAEEVDRAKSRRHKAAAQAELDVDPVAGGREEPAPSADGGAGASDSAGDKPAPVCSICGAEVTEDFARAMEIMHGSVRCKDCTP